MSIKKYIFLLLLTFYSFTNLHAQEKVEEQVLLKTPLEEVEVTKGHKQPELVFWRDKETGLQKTYDIKNDKMRFSFTPNINTDPYKLLDIVSLDFTLSMKYSKDMWLEGIFSFGRFVFHALSQVNATRPVDRNEMHHAKENVTSIGIGVGRRTKYFRDFLYSDNIYETIQAYFTLAKLHESFLNENFFGPGIRADYGVHYRFTQSMHFGFKLSYNIYALRRSEAFLDEPVSTRHLSLSWLSLGTEFSFYY